jgi:DNA polymerase V
MFGLADCNNFFVSCERVFNPSLDGKPVIVLSNNDGCVISRSNEAKRLGIRMGEPVFKIRELILKENVAVFSSNYALYGDMSGRVMDTLREMTPDIEVYSVDEAFLDLRTLPAGSLKEHGDKIAWRVRKNTGIPVSIGISKTKTLAKVAARIAKRTSEQSNCCLLDGSEEIENALKNCPAEDIWGIGRRFSRFLKDNGILTAFDFINLPGNRVHSRMSITGYRTWKELRGESCILFENLSASQKQICTSRSFPREVSDQEELYKAFSFFTSACAEKLRRQRSVCRGVNIFLLTNLFRDYMTGHYKNVVIPFETPTDSTIELLKIVSSGLGKLFKEGCSYKKGGVILTEITRKEETPGEIFCGYDVDKHSSLMECVDDINKRYGKGSIVSAAQGTERFKTSSAHLSRRYTTDWADIITVKI